MKKKIYSLLMLAMAAFAFTSCEDVPMPYDMPGSASESDEPLVQVVGDGTVENPYNVAGALYLITEGKTTDEDVAVKGIISQIDEIDTGSFGNATYYISDDGTTAKQLQVYRGYYLNGDRFKDKAAIKVGDKVIVSGKLTYHNQKTPEFAQGSSIYSLNGQGGGSQPAGEAIGSLENPKTCAEALALINALDDGAETDGNAYVKGKVVKVTTNQSNFEKYGNLNYWISDDGSETNQIQVYSGDGLNGDKFKSITDIGPGDEVVVFGKLYKYVKDGKMTPEINKGNYLVKYTKYQGGGSDTPVAPGTPKGDGSFQNPFNATAAYNAAAALGADEISAQSYYIEGVISEIIYPFDEQHGTATFWISEDDKSNTFQIYSTYYYNNQSWKEGDTQIKVGDKVVIYGQLTNYKGKNPTSTPETASKKSCIYSINGVTAEGGTPDVDPGTVSGNTITVKATDFGLSNGTNVGTQTLTDGTKLEFDGGGNNSTPKYYDAGTNIRMYPKNTMTITATKNIQKVVLNCDVYNGTICNASGDISASPGTVTVDEKVVTISSIHSKTTTITDTSSTTGAPSQIRIISIEITYDN